jgi:hypothetical protein
MRASVDTPLYLSLWSRSIKPVYAAFTVFNNQRFSEYPQHLIFCHSNLPRENLALEKPSAQTVFLSPITDQIESVGAYP